MNTFNSNYPGSLVSVCKVHYEPFGLYSKTVSKESYQNKKTGYKIYIPNDGSNLTRALFLLEQEGLITLPENADPNKN
jgi:D-methionine transport system substrate-binding protein